MKTYFESIRKKLRFWNRKMYFGSAPWTAGYITRNCRGSFANKPGKGVRVILDRWIESGWPRLQRRGRERVTDRRGKSTRRSSITGGANLPGALGLDPRGHGLTSQEHREQEEKTTNSPRAFLRSMASLRCRAARRRRRRRRREK